MAEGLAQAGAQLVITGTNQQVYTAAEEISSACGRKVGAIIEDIGDDTQRKTGFAQALKLLDGQVDILVNNAGISLRDHTALDYPLDDWQRMIQVNLEGVFYRCQQAAPLMIEKGYGKIINLASIAGIRGAINLPVYSMTKHGVVGLTRSLSNDWCKYGLRVNAIAPGFIVTDIVAKTLADPARVAHITARIPCGRFGKVEDIVGPAIFLASDASDYMTGQTLSVDGGASVYAL